MDTHLYASSLPKDPYGRVSGESGHRETVALSVFEMDGLREPLVIAECAPLGTGRGGQGAYPNRQRCRFLCQSVAAFRGGSLGDDEGRLLLLHAHHRKEFKSLENERRYGPEAGPSQGDMDPTK